MIGSASGGQPRGKEGDMTLKMAELTERARQQLAEITGFKPVAVVGSYKDAEGWHVSVDMLEMARLPESTDVLGTYLVLLDEEGTMVQFEKKRTRLRGESYEEEGE
jgi:hypothetical protein